jgi:nucleoid DNA-binding protein
MNKAELIASVAEKTGFTKKDAEKALNGFMETIKEELVAGGKVQLVGFGTFEVRDRKERQGRNPRNPGETIDIASEELSHMEIVATMINLLNGHDLDAQNATLGGIEAHVLTGLTPILANASGYLWTGAYVNETGDIVKFIQQN